jgi:hypothetical protein
VVVAVLPRLEQLTRQPVVVVGVRLGALHPERVQQGQQDRVLREAMATARVRGLVAAAVVLVVQASRVAVAVTGAMEALVFRRQ